MSEEKKKDELQQMLTRLEESSQKIIQTRGYTKEVSKIKALEEMIKEQLIYENTFCATSTSR